MLLNKKEIKMAVKNLREIVLKEKLPHRVKWHKIIREKLFSNLKEIITAMASVDQEYNNIYENKVFLIQSTNDATIFIVTR